MTQKTKSMSFHSGPIPHPEMLREYDMVCPGAAERIIKMAEDQAAHRQYLEKTTVETQAYNSKMGVIFGFVLGMTTVIAGALVAVFSHPWSGFFSSISGIAVLAGVFVYGKYANKKELIEKQKLINQMQQQNKNNGAV